MGSLAVGVRNSMLDALCRGTVFDNDEVWVKLHLGDPGAAGTSNPAAETTRKQATFGSAASGGAITNTVAVEWTNLPAAETLTHVSLWSASTGGTFLGSDDLSSSATVAIGDTFRLPVGDLDLNLPSQSSSYDPHVQLYPRGCKTFRHLLIQSLAAFAEFRHDSDFYDRSIRQCWCLR